MNLEGDDFSPSTYQSKSAEAFLAAFCLCFPLTVSLYSVSNTILGSVCLLSPLSSHSQFMSMVVAAQFQIHVRVAVSICITLGSRYFGRLFVLI